MRAVDLEQGSQQWLTWRQGGIGGSDIGIIMGINPWCTAYKLWQKKRGIIPEEAATPAMKRGIFFEPAARAAFEAEQGIDCFPVCGEREDKPHHRASLDGITMDNEVVEIKVPGIRALAQAREGVIPDHYTAQIQWQMYVSGAKDAYYYVYDPDKVIGYTMRLERDDAFIAAAIEAADNFWYHLESDTPPEISGDDYIVVDDTDIVALAQKVAEHKTLIAQIRSQLKNVEQLEKKDKTLLLDALDDGNAIVGPLKITRVSKAQYDYKKMVEDYDIDLEKYKRPSIGYPLITLLKADSS